jgi:hypothetical protein
MIRVGLVAPVIAVVLSSLVVPVAAHHGGGSFDSTKAVEYKGVLRRLDLVNPHSWIYFDVTDAAGNVSSHRCEMRAATVLRRSGWTMERFKPGQRITIEGSADKFDPNSCYLNTIVLEDGSRADRYGQFTTAPVRTADRPARRPSGEPNIAGDWAPEQLVMTDPRGRGGALVPLSTVAKYKPGEGRIGGAAGAAGRGGPQRYRGAELTEVGAKASAAFRTFDPKDSPRMRCETTSVIFDWAFDGPVNRITQNRDTIVIQYGQLGFTRTVHMNLKAHPSGLKPSRAGHSIGRWENDVLVVDTVGFAPGVLSPPVLHGDRLHVVERFSLDAAKMELTRSYTAEDPVYFTGQYAGADTMQVADLPYGPDTCVELGFVNYAKEGQRNER